MSMETIVIIMNQITIAFIWEICKVIINLHFIFPGLSHIYTFIYKIYIKAHFFYIYMYKVNFNNEDNC